tara:strand:+ start:654 stop:875 length:222 start_codon:yes stop_codon:yes gene_type:complete
MSNIIREVSKKIQKRTGQWPHDGSTESQALKDCAVILFSAMRNHEIMNALYVSKGAWSSEEILSGMKKVYGED